MVRIAASRQVLPGLHPTYTASIKTRSLQRLLCTTAESLIAGKCVNNQLPVNNLLPCSLISFALNVTKMVTF